MFYIDVTFEDIRIKATSEQGGIYKTVIHDKYTGNSADRLLSALHLSYIFQFLLDPDGEPEGHEKMRAELQPELEGLPIELMPIP